MAISNQRKAYQPKISAGNGEIWQRKICEENLKANKCRYQRKWRKSMKKMK